MDTYYQTAALSWQVTLGLIVLAWAVFPPRSFGRWLAPYLMAW